MSTDQRKKAKNVNEKGLMNNSVFEKTEILNLPQQKEDVKQTIW